MFIRAHEAGYMCVTTLSEKDLPVLALGRCPYSYLEYDVKATPLTASEFLHMVFVVYGLQRKLE